MKTNSKGFDDAHNHASPASALKEGKAVVATEGPDTSMSKVASIASGAVDSGNKQNPKLPKA